MHRALPGRIGQPPRPLQREPGLGPAARRQRVEGRLRDRVHVVAGRVLHEEAPGLELDVLAVGVGQQVLPHAARAGQRPEPHLLPRHVLVAGPVAPAVAVVVVVAAKEVVQLADDVVGLVPPEGVVAVERQEAARVIDRPGPFAAGMLQVGPAGHEDFEVVLGERRRGHPVVVGLFVGRGIVPQGAGLEVGAARLKADLDPPVGTRRQVHRADEGAHAAVVVLAQDVVDGGRGGRGVPDDAEVELDAAGRPRPPQRDVPELHHLVPIDELVARFLDHRAPHLPPDLRQHVHLDQVVLHLDDLPLARLGCGRIPLEGMVRVQPAVAGQDRHRIGVREGIGGQHPRLLGDAGRGGGRGDDLNRRYFLGRQGGLHGQHAAGRGKSGEWHRSENGGELRQSDREPSGTRPRRRLTGRRPLRMARK